MSEKISAPGAKSSSEFIAFMGASGLAVVSEALEFVGLPHLDPIMALSLVAGALVYGGIITVQKRFVGNANVQLAQMGATYVQNAVNGLASDKKVEVTAEITPAPAGLEPMEVIFSDSKQEEPIPVNFAPVEKVVN